jgi:D-tyrosyl-tRNA(Tyr) deacylase
VKALLQRVSEAQVRIGGETIAAIGPGLLILLGVGYSDSMEIARKLAEKIATLRIFEDADGKTNLSVLDAGGAALVISQFTLYADTRRGRRPSFTDAAAPELAGPLVDSFTAYLEALGVPVRSGEFGARMEIALVNQGPMTILLES